MKIEGGRIGGTAGRDEAREKISKNVCVWGGDLISGCL